VSFAALILGRCDNRHLADSRQRLRQRKNSWRAHAIVVGDQNAEWRLSLKGYATPAWERFRASNGKDREKD
jgi:hypothetical protein